MLRGFKRYGVGKREGTGWNAEYLCLLTAAQMPFYPVTERISGTAYILMKRCPFKFHFCLIQAVF